MFLRRSFELMTFCGYWCGLIPLIYGYLTHEGIIQFDMNKPLISAANYGLYLAGAIAIYMIVHRVSLWVYFAIKLSDKKYALSLKNIDQIAQESIIEKEKKSIIDKIFFLEKNGTKLPKTKANGKAKNRNLTANEPQDTIIQIENNKAFTKLKSKDFKENKENLAKPRTVDPYLIKIKEFHAVNQNPSPMSGVHNKSNSQPELDHIQRYYGKPAPSIPPTGRQAIDKMKKSQSQDNVHIYPNLAHTSGSLPKSIDTQSLLRPSQLRKTYTNPDLLSSDANWV